MAKKIIAVVACLAIIASFVGCGQKVTFNTEDWADMEIRVAGYRLFNDDPLNYEFAAGADKFTEEYGTKVSFLVGGGDGLGDDLVSGIMSGDPWEIQYCFGISVFPLTFAEDLYTPINDYIDYDNNDKIDKVTVEGTKWLGNYYGVSALPMQEVWYLAYNETWMKELGIKTPYEYYEEGKWNWDAYKTICAKAVEAGSGTRSEVRRPHTGRKYMSKWDLDKGEVTITYDSPENVEWLNFWGDLITNPRYDYFHQGYVSERGIMMRDNVMPEIMEYEITNNTNDVIRYINFPGKDGEVSSYMTDGHFMFVNGISEEELQCSIELATYMVDEQSKKVDSLYKENMNEEDYAIWEKTLDNITFLPGAFYDGVWEIGDKFIADMKAGKSVATHIAENTESLKAKAEEYNEKYAEGYNK